MEERVMKVLRKQNEFDSQEMFALYEDKQVIGEKILNSLLSKRIKDENTSFKRFFSTDSGMKVGYLSDIYGLVGVLSTINRYQVKISEETKKEITDYIYYVIDSEYIKNNLFGLSPYVRQDIDHKLFGLKNYFTGSLTWSLSLFVSIRSMMLKGELDIDDKYKQKIFDKIKYILNQFTTYLVGTKDQPKGWGYTNGCTEASLFFTYSVLEAYSDFEDNVLFQSDDDSEYFVLLDEDINPKKVKDQELYMFLEFENGGLISTWRKLCEKVSDNTYEIYKDILKEGFVDDNFLKDINSIQINEILKFNSSNALFNNLYIVFLFIYGYVNNRKDQKRNKEVIELIDIVLQNVHNTYNSLKKLDKDYIVDKYNLIFDEPTTNEDRSREYARTLNQERLISSTLLPMLIKANNLIAFYVTQYPNKKLKDQFEQLFDNVIKNEWVWEGDVFDVLITERYIEAIADFYDYYEKYEKKYIDVNIKTEEIRQKAEEKATRKLRPKLRQEIEKEFNLKFEEGITKTKSEFTIENAIIDKIEKIIDNKLNQFKEKQLYNINSFIENIVSMMEEKVIEVSSINKDTKDKEEILNDLSNDLYAFLSIWVEAHVDKKKQKLTDIMDKIGEEN